MNRGLTAEAAAQLQEGINLVLSRWAALRMAVENEWGGRDSLQKSQQLGLELFQKLALSNEQVYVDDLEDMLDNFMDLTFKAEIDDGSIEEVALNLMEMHEECLQGNFDSVQKLKGASVPTISCVRQSGSDDEDESDDEDGDDLEKENCTEMEVDVTKCQSGVNQKETMTGERSMKGGPEVVDGWTVVGSRRSKGRRN